MNVDRIKTLIKVWQGKAARERDIFSKFMFLWICFNAWLDYRSNETQDSQMISWLVSQTSNSCDLVELFNNLKKTKNFNNYLKIFSNLSPIGDSRGRRQPIVIHDENDFENIVKGIYRIRCNLFHGGKEAHIGRDQKLVSISNHIMNKWIASLIASWR